MLSYDDALNMEYYKKTSYTGWMGGMRFLMKKEDVILEEATEDTPAKKGDPIFHVWVWPGPYIFDLTDKSKMFDTTFPFNNEGRENAVDWINEQYEEHKALWPRRKTDEK